MKLAKEWLGVVIVLIAALALGVLALCGNPDYDARHDLDNYYTTTAICVAVDKENYTVTFEDAGGNLWVIENEDTVQEGDLFSLLMFNGGTEFFWEDDEIIEYNFGNLINQKW